jgi:hypothetical protein
MKKSVLLDVFARRKSSLKHKKCFGEFGVLYTKDSENNELKVGK